MHEWIMGIGYAVISYFQRVAAVLLQALQIAGTGMLGIFVVIGIIVLAVILLNEVFSKK